MPFRKCQVFTYFKKIIDFSDRDESDEAHPAGAAGEEKVNGNGLGQAHQAQAGKTERQTNGANASVRFRRAQAHKNRRTGNF